MRNAEWKGGETCFFKKKLFFYFPILPFFSGKMAETWYFICFRINMNNKENMP